MIKDVIVFDCTIRESGYQTGWFYDDEFVKSYYLFLDSVGIDYMELGFFHREDKDPNKGPYRYSSEKNDYLNGVFSTTKRKTKISSMIDLQRPMAEVLPKSESVIDSIRIINRSHENNFKILENKINELKNKGYEVSINYTSAGYNSRDLNRSFLSFAKSMDVFSVYFADTESHFTVDYVKNLIDDCNAIGVDNYGLHLHDKALVANKLMLLGYKLGCRRFDATLLGFGGKWHDWNLTTEFLLSHFDIKVDPLVFNNLRRDLVQQIVKFKAFDTTIY